MSRVTKTFEINARAGIEKTGQDIAHVIDEILSSETPGSQKKPIILSIQSSSDNSGKSAFWDIIRENLFYKGGIFITKQSDSSEQKDRVYETWVGDTNTRQDLRLLVCNVGFLGYEWMQQVKYEQLVKFLARENNLANFDVIILSKSNDHFIAPNLHDLGVNLEYILPYSNSSSYWDRTITLLSQAESPFAKLCK